MNTDQMPFSAEEWSQTPPSVQEFMLFLVMRVQALEAEVIGLREQVNRNSHNSSQYRLHTLTCAVCGTETRAELPEGVPAGAFGPRLQGMVSLLSGGYHLSKRDSQAIMADFFLVDMGLGSVSALEQRTSETLSPPVDELRSYVRTQPVAHLDETSWREANQKAWL